LLPLLVLLKALCQIHSFSEQSASRQVQGLFRSELSRVSSPFLNPLAPSDPYMGRTAQLTSRRCILNTYSTNIRTDILNVLHNLRFFLFKMPFIS
jgi:hypothetical protein